MSRQLIIAAMAAAGIALTAACAHDGGREDALSREAEGLRFRVQRAETLTALLWCRNNMLERELRGIPQPKIKHPPRGGDMAYLDCWDVGDNEPRDWPPHAKSPEYRYAAP